MCVCGIQSEVRAKTWVLTVIKIRDDVHVKLTKLDQSRPYQVLRSSDREWKCLESAALCVVQGIQKKNSRGGTIRVTVQGRCRVPPMNPLFFFPAAGAAGQRAQHQPEQQEDLTPRRGAWAVKLDRKPIEELASRSLSQNAVRTLAAAVGTCQLLLLLLRREVVERECQAIA